MVINHRTFGIEIWNNGRTNKITQLNWGIDLKKNKLLLFLCILFVSIFSSACSLKSNEVNSKQQLTESITSKLEGTNKTEKNYLFFNKSEGSKTITLSFYNAYNKIPISSIVLYDGEKIVSDNTKTLDTMISEGGKFVFQLNEYIPVFNKVEFKDIGGKTIFKLNTGNYFFEKVNVQNNINEENKWLGEGYKADSNSFEYIINMNFIRNEITESKISILNSNDNKVNNFSLTESHKFTENKKNLNFTYTATTDKHEKGSYEIILIQKDNDNTQNVMSTVLVPMMP